MQCKWCGTEFELKHGNQLYCSDECRRKSTNHRLKVNKARKEAGEKLLYHKVCIECGAKFDTDREYTKYCSEECCTNAWRKKNKAKYANLRYGEDKWETRICPHCGKEYRCTKAKKMEYCTFKCLYQHNREQAMEERTCPGCGTVFKPRILSQEYCSKVCMYRSAKRRQRGRERRFLEGVDGVVRKVYEKKKDTK